MSETKQIILIVSIVFFVWLIGGVGAFFVPERGTFGDMFGAVNSLFSGLAFAGVVYAILMQRKELELQRAELSLLKDELARSANSGDLSLKISCLNALADAYGSEIRHLKKQDDIHSEESVLADPLAQERVEELSKRISHLFKNIDEVAKQAGIDFDNRL